jgi:hypothetical protein
MRDHDKESFHGGPPWWAPAASSRSMHPCAPKRCDGCCKRSGNHTLPARFVGPSSQYLGVHLVQTTEVWMVKRSCKQYGREIYLGLHHSEEEAAHVSDLSAICMGVGTAKLNFSASEYEAGGRWEVEAREAARVDIDEFATMWLQRASQRTLDGVHSLPLDLCRLSMLVRHCSASNLACNWSLWHACVCGPASACSFHMQALAVQTHCPVF